MCPKCCLSKFRKQEVYQIVKFWSLLELGSGEHPLRKAFKHGCHPMWSSSQGWKHFLSLSGLAAPRYFLAFDSSQFIQSLSVGYLVCYKPLSFWNQTQVLRLYSLSLVCMQNEQEFRIIGKSGWELAKEFTTRVGVRSLQSQVQSKLAPAASGTCCQSSAYQHFPSCSLTKLQCCL